jgi:hypothetical protein
MLVVTARRERYNPSGSTNGVYAPGPFGIRSACSNSKFFDLCLRALWIIHRTYQLAK